MTLISSARVWRGGVATVLHVGVVDLNGGVSQRSVIST